jgi:hypothetical protein
MSDVGLGFALNRWRKTVEQDCFLFFYLFDLFPCLLCLCKSQKLVRYFEVLNKKAQRDTGARTFREFFVGLGRKMFMGLGLTDLKIVGLEKRRGRNLSGCLT